MKDTFEWANWVVWIYFDKSNYVSDKPVKTVNWLPEDEMPF
jgi:hypothetical protein